MRRWLVVLALVVAGPFLGAVPAAAHGDQGQLVVAASLTAQPLVVVVRVQMTYLDGDLVAAGEAGPVVVRVTQGDRTVEAELTAQELLGRWEGTVTVPGAGPWTVTVVSTKPEALAAVEVVVPDAPPVTTTTTEAATAPPARPGLTAVAGDDDGNGENALTPVAVLVALMAVAAGGAVALRQWRRRGPKPPRSS